MQPSAPAFSDFFILGEIAEGSIRYTDVDWFMVIISYLVAALASYLAMLILRCVQAAPNKTPQIMLGAITFGTGIWSMHFIGMLAAKTEMVHEYEPITTTVSWLVAVLCCYVVLYNLAYRQMTRARILALAPLLAIGVTAMHYIGMAAMRMQALMRYEIIWFVFSVAIALAASIIMLTIMAQALQKGAKRPYMTQAGAALVMALGICGLHYCGMVATVFTPFADCRFDANQSHIELVLIVAACTLIVMGAATLLVIWTAMETPSASAARRWPYVYYLLASFNMLTVACGLYMNHRMIEMYNTSQMARNDWLSYNEELLVMNQSISRLSKALVPLPDGSYPSVTVEKQMTALVQQMATFKRLVSENTHASSGNKHATMLAQLMHDVLQREYASLQHLHADLAQLNKSDERAQARKHIDNHINQLQRFVVFASRQIAESQQAITRYSNEQSTRLTKINTVIYLVLITLVVFATAGGMRVVRRIRQTQDEKNQYLGKLQESQLNLMESQAFLKKIIDSVADPIFVKNRRHQWIAVNTALSDMLGYPAEMLIGKSDFDIFPNEQASVFWEMDEKLFQKNETIVNEENIRTRAGDDRTILTKKVPITLSDGTTGIVGIIHDITAQNMIRDELRLHRDNLAQMVAEQTKDLLDAKNKAEQANKAKSEFLSNMSHELRTPIHAIKSFAELSRDLISRELNEQERHKISRFMHHVIVSVDRLGLLVGDLLNMSKLDAGKVQYHFEPVNVPALVSNSFDELHGLMLDKDIRYDLEVEETTGMAEVDQRMIIQVVINLLSNAIKFSPDNGALYCRIARDGDEHILIALSDEGPGIPESELMVVFDKFIQSSKTKTNAGGTGLGLAICRQIVEAHRGTIWFKNNTDGPGVTAFVRLPIHHATS